MRILRDFSHAPQGAVVALGNFDGVHLGHQAILTRCIETAKAANAPSAVMTFEPHPREFFARLSPPPLGGRPGGGRNGEMPSHNAPTPPSPCGGGSKLRIYSFRQKVEIIREMGIDLLFVVRFNKQFSSHTADDFVSGILHGQLAVRHIITGSNFAFGKGRGGDTGFMAQKAAELGFGFTPCPPVQDAGGMPVSSSAIRAFLAEGNMAAASSLLGRDYSIEGRVVRGEQRGRTLGFPTANISLRRLFKPRFGVYAVRLDGQDGVASIGVKPTFGEVEPLLEVHLFDSNDNLYGKRVRVEFAAFLREEKRFDSAAALCAQMEQDAALARATLKGQT